MSAPRPGRGEPGTSSDGAPTPAETVASDVGTAPTPAPAARQAKADRSTRGVLAAVLCLEALVVLLVPRAIAQTSTGLDTSKTLVLVALAVVLVATGFLLRRRWGIGLGSVLQLVFLATGVWTVVMLFIGILFVAIWLWVLTMRRDLAGTPNGYRMLIS